MPRSSFHWIKKKKKRNRIGARIQTYITPGQAEAETENQRRGDWAPPRPASHCHKFYCGALWQKPPSGRSNWNSYNSARWRAERARGPGIQSVRGPVDYTHHSLVSRAILQEGRAVNEKVTRRRRRRAGWMQAVRVREDKFCSEGQILETRTIFWRCGVMVQTVVGGDECSVASMLTAAVRRSAPRSYRLIIGWRCMAYEMTLARLDFDLRPSVKSSNKAESK